MRYLIIVVISIIILGCSGNKPGNHSQIGIISGCIPFNDTFKLEYQTHLQVPEGIYLDTIKKIYKESGGEECIILPRLKGKEFTASDALLTGEIKRRLSGEGRMSMASDSAVEITRYTTTTEPVSIYKSDKLISYAFISTYSEPGAMRPYRTYISVNYDMQKNKLLHLNDYFNIAAPGDTAMLLYVIYSAVGERESTYWKYNGYDNLTDFAVDADKLYFYFDQFSAGGNPCGLEGSVKKKYYLNLIRNEYR
jgi:hypothetical protein